jgi:Mn-containing catalase
MAGTSSQVVYRGYTDSSPYPPIRVAGRNERYAELLMDDFAGPKGEFTAMSLYFYQHYTAGEGVGDYGVMTMRIAIAELNHMNILSAVIRRLGGNPVFRGGPDTNCKKWTAGSVPYAQDLGKSLRIALEGETNAIESYRRHAEMIDDPFVKSIVARILLDEELHRSYIAKMLAAYGG